MKLYRIVVIGCLLLVVASCAGTPSNPNRTGPAYTCCEETDINRDYQPGQTLSVHWIVAPGKISTASSAHQVELNARLNGPYASVTDLKTVSDKNLVGGVTFTAEPVRPSGQPAEQPVSFVLIPSTAAPGYYNLITSVTEPPGSHGGASIVHVIPKT